MCIRPLLLALAFTAAACGGKKDDAPKSSEKPAEKVAKPEPKAEEPKPDPEPAKPAAIDPATFVAVDLAPTLDVTTKAPAGAVVTPDPPGFNESVSKGVTVGSGEFALHVWRSTIGQERDAARMTAVDINGGKFTETKNDITLIEFTTEKDGANGYGFFTAIKGLDKGGVKGDQLICGNLEPVASPEELEPYRAACKSIAKK